MHFVESWWKILWGFSLLFGLIAACSSIERTNQIQNAPLVAGSSTKSDVVNMIGLPAKTERSEAQKIEIWLYTGKPLNHSYFVPLPIASTPIGTFYFDVGKKNIIDDQQVILICVFDEAGRLLWIENPTKGER